MAELCGDRGNCRTVLNADENVHRFSVDTHTYVDVHWEKFFIENPYLNGNVAVEEVEHLTPSLHSTASILVP